MDKGLLNSGGSLFFLISAIKFTIEFMILLGERFMELKDVIDIETLSNIIQTIPSCIFFKDTDLKYVFSTHYWEQINHKENFEIYGKTDRDIRKDTENVEAAEKKDREIIETGVGTSYKIKSVIDGHIQHLDIKKEPVRNKDGKIIGIVGLINDITQMVELEQKLEYTSNFDDLTKIRNRQSGTYEINNAIITKRTKYFCILDVDKFKSVNDTYGHKTGDILLQEIASALTKTADPDDIICRIGGDEFAMLIFADNADQMINHKIKNLFSNIDSIRIPAAPDLRIHISLGITRVHNRDTFDRLYVSADEAMYAAKKEDCNSFKWY